MDVDSQAELRTKDSAANARSGGQERMRVALVLFMGVATGWLSPSLQAAAITFNTALPLSQNEVVLREQLVVSEQGPLNRQSLNTVVGYGVTPKFALFGMVPVTRVEIGDLLGVDSGIADASLFGRYEVLRRDAAGATLRVSPFAGVRLPTASADLLGDSSTDALLGVIVTAATTKRTIDAQLRLELNGSHDSFRAGHRGQLDVSFQHRAWPERITQRTAGFVYAVLESSLSYQGRSRSLGESVDDSGWQWFLIPGLQYVRQRWIADLAVKIPVATNLDAQALRTDYSVFASVRVNF